MCKSTRKLLGLLVNSTAILLLSGCATQTTGHTQAQQRIPAENPKDLEAETFNQVNQYRASQGKPAVARNAGLDSLARQHAVNLLNRKGKGGLYSKNANHDGWEERSFAARRNQGFTSCGENVLWSSYRMAPGRIKDGWVGSPSHQKNMIGVWDSAGLGIITGPEGDLFAVQIFGLKNPMNATSARFRSW